MLLNSTLHFYLYSKTFFHLIIDRVVIVQECY